MPSSFFTLEIALRGMQAQQVALSVAAHNIGNVNTPGYSRQQPILEATSSYPVPAFNRPLGAAQMGTGVKVAAIQRLRDQFLDRCLREEFCNLGFWETQQSTLEQVEVIFMEPGENGLGENLNQFWASFQELSKYPESLPVRTTVVETATALTEAMRHTYQQLEALKANLVTTLEIKVAELNNLAGQIAQLNKQIASVKIAGDNPNDLLDQRDLLLDKIASVVNFTSTEDAQGRIKVMIAGKTFIEGTEVQALKVETAPELQLLWEDGTPIFWEDLQGELKGIYQVHSRLLTGYLQDLDTFAQGLIAAVNTIHRTGFNLKGESELDFFAGTGARDIKVNPEIAANGANIAAAATLQPDGSVLPGDNENALGLAQLRNRRLTCDEENKILRFPEPGETGEITLDEFYQGLATRLGIDVQMAKQMVTSEGALVGQLNKRKEALVGVSLDEETARTIQFQRAYEAAARVITVLDEMLDTLINRMAV